MGKMLVGWDKSGVDIDREWIRKGGEKVDIDIRGRSWPLVLFDNYFIRAAYCPSRADSFAFRAIAALLCFDNRDDIVN